MREITQPMRLFDFVFGPLVLPLQDLDAREGELFLTTAQWQQQCRHAGFSKVAWLPQDGSPTAGMSEHIILATLPGQAVSAVTFTAPSEPVLGQALTDNGDYLADWSDCAGQPERFNARWQDGVCFHSVMATLYLWNRPVAAPVAGEGSLKLAKRSLFRGQMRVEARHPAGSGCRYRPPRLFLRRRRIINGAGRPSTSPALTIRLPLASAPVRLRAATSWRNTASFTIRTPLRD
ncbi:hypothetical protein ECZU38_18880 [Escherichia coli]|nr:hypothetical protein ECZU38_18880 [Escherichia coli]